MQFKLYVKCFKRFFEKCDIAEMFVAHIEI